MILKLVSKIFIQRCNHLSVNRLEVLRSPVALVVITEEKIKVGAEPPKLGPSLKFVCEFLDP